MSAIPRVRHMRHGRFARLRKSEKPLVFIGQQATRTGKTQSFIYESMRVPGSAVKVLDIPNVVIP